jgi:putative selenate reductase
MAELIPAPFNDLITRLYREPVLQGSIFELPRRKWYVPPPDGPDMTVRFHGRAAGGPLGPAAGPHTQMAQNLLLSYLAGARIMELKTVQVDDRLKIGRPCIDMTNVGYNIEWSQELCVGDSLREYVAGSMLIHMLRHSREFADLNLRGPEGEVLYDISLGYGLAGIRSEKVQRFLDGMRDARVLIEQLRAEIPAPFAAARELEFPTHISDSVTLSTFHGCPADEIERICEFLLTERDLDVIVKMNPPMLGRERLEHLLYDVLGYTELVVNPKIYAAGLTFDESLGLCARLTRLAAARGRSFGFKFSNTLEVLNHRTFFTPDNPIMYLSGQPLYVITMTLTDEFRRAVGPDVPISFSAGIDRHNFADAVACGFVPITVSTDLLRPGGYGRLPGYLDSLMGAMRACGATSIDEYIVKRFYEYPSPRLAADAQRRAVARREHSASDDPQRAPARACGPAAKREPCAVSESACVNTSVAAEMARQDPRYRADQNRRVPKRIDSQLETFDCITCDKCLPVCPNAANFTYPTPQVSFEYRDILVAPDGTWRYGEPKRFEIRENTQIACYADFCNECGNCDTFCPEYGGPYIKKPSFFGSMESWQRARPRDGFVVSKNGGAVTIRGRIRGHDYLLRRESSGERFLFDAGAVTATFSQQNHSLLELRLVGRTDTESRVDVGIYHTLRFLLNGVLDQRRIHQVNATNV